MNIFKSKWSKWKDVSSSNIGEGMAYILQVRRHKNGKIQMRVEHVSNAYGCQPPTLENLKTV